MKTTYNIYMKIKTPTAHYLESIYLKWINQVGEVRTQKEFAEFLGIEYTSWNRHYNGKRKEIDYLTAIKICEKASQIPGVIDPYELLDILSYPRPYYKNMTNMINMITEATHIIHERGLEENSPEEEQVIRETAAKYGITVYHQDK